jgi:zinc protease
MLIQLFQSCRPLPKVQNMRPTAWLAQPRHRIGACLLLAFAFQSIGKANQPDPSYAVLIANQTLSDPDWQAVAETLQRKHSAKIIPFNESPDETLPELQEHHPTFVCWVAKSSEAGRQEVSEMHALCRQIDADPYYDCIWGILTGYDASDARRIANRRDPLIVRRVGSGTEVELELCQQGEWFCELVQGKHVVKNLDGKIEQRDGPADTTSALAALLTNYNADLFVTSGHATERNWQIGFRYRNGYFVSKAGQLYGRDTKGSEFPIQSDHTRVYLPIGNCLMGHIDGPDAMALAWMHSGGVHQMIGYTVPTWYGYAGWGMLDYFVEQPGRYTFAESFYVNQQALIHRLHTYFPEVAERASTPGRMDRQNITCGEAAQLAGLTNMDGAGLLFDRDVVAFYGDPGWESRMADGPQHWKQTLEQKGNRFTFRIDPLMGRESFVTVNKNGAQRGGRPFVQRLGQRIQNIRILEGKEHAPLVADDFILVPRPDLPNQEPIEIVFSADRIPAEQSQEGRQ